MQPKIGEINQFTVKRETDISYILTLDGNEEEFFLHFNETLHPLKVNDKIDAFLYYDNKKRLAATMKLPNVTVNKIGFAEVVNINPKIGLFMNIGISKDILLSIDELPKNLKAWPTVGDKLPIILRLKTSSMVAHIPSKQELPNLDKFNLKDKLDGIVTHFTSTGLIAVTDNLTCIYIHNSLMRKKYHLGEKINITIVGINKHNEYDGSLIEQKETMMENDAAMILNYLNSFGVVPLGDKSTPEEIQKIFPLSKSAFKRSIGKLYKQHLIIIEDYRIIKTKD